MLQSIHFVPPNSLLTITHPLLKPPSQTFLNKPTSTHFLSSNLRSVSHQWPLISASAEEGPIELSPDIPSIFATNDDPTPLQVSTSVLLTGAISIFLFRSVRRRAKRAKELRMRSSGAKSIKEEALDSLKAIGSVSVESKAPPSPVQAFLGAISAGVIALILYKFTTTIEASLNRQTVSDNFSIYNFNMTAPTSIVSPLLRGVPLELGRSFDGRIDWSNNIPTWYIVMPIASDIADVRQITVTVRTIINGLCYLATFVFGMNSIGLFLYSGQLALSPLFEDFAGNNEKTNGEQESGSSDVSSESPTTLENKDTDQTS
ncbi:Elongator complex protein 1 [Bienertia sinuspersici]